MKLEILIFGCPEKTHITNFTRMPQVHHNDNDIIRLKNLLACGEGSHQGDEKVEMEGGHAHY